MRQRFMPKRSIQHVGLALVLALVLSQGTHAQDYPTRPVTLVVPYAPGAATDTIARLLGQKLEQRLGKPVVVENRTGAGTVIGASYVARATPDGHTLLHATSTTMAINVRLYKKLAYDPAKDFVPVALVAGVPFILVVNPDLPVRSVADLVALARTRPLSFASSGPGSAAHLYAELLKSMTGIVMTHVPYRGLAPALNDLVAGHVSLMFGDFGTSLELVRAGKLRALGVSTAERNQAAPDLPTIAEAGLPGYEASAWHMLAAPAKTPSAIVARLNSDLRTIAGDAVVQKEFLARGLSPLVTPPPDALARFVGSEIARWGKVVEQAGIAETE
jgi:tripartite-type tricarboxylate transporter receptor subunit TctC